MSYPGITYASDLLEGDSEMRKALGGLDSYDGDSMQNGRARMYFASRPLTY